MSDPDGSILTVQLIAFFICILFSALFSASETAFLSVRKHRLTSRAEEGSAKAKRALRLLADRDRLITTILVGNNIVNLSASALSTSMALQLFGSGTYAGIATSVATGIVTLVVLIFGEITPKTLATRYAESFAEFLSPMLRFFEFILYPVVICMNGITKLFLLLTKKDAEEEPDYTEEELMSMVNIGHEQGVILNEEKSMLHNVFQFGDGLIKEIMTPRVNVISIDETWSYSEIMEVYREHQFSRMPVYREDQDHIIGSLNIKDIALAGVNDETFRIQDLMRDVVVCYDFKDIREAFDRMRQARTGLAIACDEYGIMTGVVSMEDILEEIVGDITDEYDEEEEDPIQEEEDGSYTMDGSVSIDDFNDKAGSELNSEQVESVGGYVLNLLDDLPEEGMTVDSPDGSVTFIIRNVDNHRITSLSAMVTPVEDEEGEASGNGRKRKADAV